MTLSTLKTPISLLKYCHQHLITNQIHFQNVSKRIVQTLHVFAIVLKVISFVMTIILYNVSVCEPLQRHFTALMICY